MGTIALELKLAQELSSINQDPLFLVILDLRKSYDTLDRGHLFTTLEGYSSGSHLCGILVEFWERQEVYTWENGYHVPHLQVASGKTQGGLIEPTLFNIAVDNAVPNRKSHIYLTV